MALRKHWLDSFYFKVAALFILSLLFVALLGNFILYRYSLKMQFNQLRDKLIVIAQTAALSVDGDELAKVPLNPEGVKSDSFKNIALKLLKIKKANPVIKYIYIAGKTEKNNMLQFIVDPDALLKNTALNKASSNPGDIYDASNFPEMLKAFTAPTADRKLGFDQWGKLLSGYAPIRDKNNQVKAILGLDIDAADVALAEAGLLRRGIFVLFIGVIFSLGLGLVLTLRITTPIKKLNQATRHIAEGDLDYRVDFKSYDEIGQLADSFNKMALNLADSRQKLQDYFYRVVQSMVRSLEAKDSYTRGHSDRVSDYAYQIALKMGFPVGKAELLRKVAQLHDIGKLGIHEEILNKKDKLSDEEWSHIHKHPEVGEEILKPVFLDPQLLSIVRSHHERYDGMGYPDRLKGDQINILSQIVSVADAYDAMTSSRSYRKAMSSREALTRIQDGSGTQFNPVVVQAFIKTINP